MRLGVSGALILSIAIVIILAGVLSFQINSSSLRGFALQPCAEARALLQSADYDPTNGELSLTIYNYGKVPLQFSVTETYKNNAKSDNLLITNPLSVSTHKITGVQSELQEITIISRECSSVFDSLKWYEIRGL